MVIPQLPNEIVEAILLRLVPLSDSEESVRALCRVAQTNSRLLAIARLSHIWQPHYAARWRRCDAARDQRRKATTERWWLLYATRSQIDRRALGLLDAIIAGPDGRDVIGVELTQDLGYDVWEVISAQTSRIRNHEFQGKSTQVVVPAEALTRQYWAREILCVISRVRAINTWKAMSDPLEAVSFEQALASLSAFFGEDIEKIFEEFDRLARSCQVYISCLDLPQSADQTETIVQICTWMRQEGFVRADAAGYHNLLNHFPHRVLFNHQRTLPMSLVYVFVCIARRLGLDAFPVAFPQKVLAVVLPPEGEPIYVDVFDSATRPILSSSSDLPAMLQSIGINPATLSRWTPPARTTAMLHRAAANILNSLEMMTTWSGGDHLTAHYAANCALLLLTRDARLVQALFVGGIVGPLDHEVVFRGALRPILPAGTRAQLDLHLAKQVDPEKRVPRSAGRSNIIHFTGMIFRHRTYHYVGLIKGWDYHCEAGSEWIHRMHIGDLPRGSNQPFYPSFTPDGHTRYVAEENIEPIGRPTASDIRVLIAANRDLGRWFEGVEFTETGASRFIMSPESRILYPEDNAAGHTFLAEHS